MKDFRRFACLLFVISSGYLLDNVNAAANLVINPTGATQNQPAGRNFGLTCKGETDSGNLDLFRELKWIGPRGEITEGSSGQIEVSSIGGSLVLMFKSPASDDSGSYNCTAVYDNIDHLATSVNMIFYQDITWEDCPKQQALVINSDGKINCRVSANPPATITWTRHAQPLTDQYTTQTDGVQVRGVTEADKGEFAVRAMVAQTGRFQTRIINVEVHVPPEIIELDDKAEAIEGSDTRLMCQASGFPLPHYSWFDKNHRNLSLVDGFVVDSDDGTLRFLSVKRNDQGPYTCKAKNPAGEAERSLDFNVIVKPEIKVFENITAIEGKTATFECHAYGDPPPEMSIRKDGMDRPFSDMDDKVKLTRRNEEGKAVLTLKIEMTSRADDGLYYCMAENKGAHVSKVGHLTVEFAPVLSSTPLTLVKAWAGHSMNVTCVAESIPNASITWYYLGQKIRNDDVYTVFEQNGISNLLVRPPLTSNRNSQTVYGTYKCEALNNHGDQHINIELQEARTPSILRDVESREATATTLTFKFHGPHDDGGMPILAYVAKFREESAPYGEDTPHEWSEGSVYMLDKLRPRTAYYFSFAARNEVGVGEWSIEKRIVMPQESAPEPPKFISPSGNISTYPDRFNIRWTLPLDNGRKIQYFELRYFETEQRNKEWKISGDPVTRKITNWAYSPMYEMTHLKADTPYKIEVRAYNEIGMSQAATMVFHTAPDPSKRSQDHSPVILPGSGNSGMSNGYHASSSGSLSYGAIAAIIIVLVLVILLLIDVTCFVRYHWGVLHLLRDRVCSKPINDKAKEAAAEEGKGGKGDKLEEKSRTEVDNPAFDAKDTKPNDGGDGKNKSPKGSKSSIAKDSLV